MPISTNLQTATVRDANAAMALSFFSNWRGGFWPKICRPTTSTRNPEPFSLLGAVPMMSAWYGKLNETPIASFSMLAPNLVFKNFERVDRSDLELDQIGGLIQRMSGYGIRLAQIPDWLAAIKLIQGESQTTVTDPQTGIPYPATFEPNVPFFSTAHTTYGGYNQSNLLQGVLPETLTELAALDIPAQAGRMQKDLQTVLTQIASIVDDKGAQIFPEFDASKQLVCVVPMALVVPARLAFSTLGATIGGSNGAGGSSGATTNITPMFVKEVVVSGLLGGCLDITAQSPALTSPPNPTDYYFLIVDGYSSALFLQWFRPKNLNEIFPLGVNYNAQIDGAIAAAKKSGIPVTREAADVFSTADIGTNIAALGAAGQESVYATEQFFFSGRTRAAMNWGAWFYGYKVKASQSS